MSASYMSAAGYPDGVTVLSDGRMTDYITPAVAGVVDEKKENVVGELKAALSRAKACFARSKKDATVSKWRCEVARLEAELESYKEDNMTDDETDLQMEMLDLRMEMFDEAGLACQIETVDDVQRLDRKARSILMEVHGASRDRNMRSWLRGIGVDTMGKALQFFSPGWDQDKGLVDAMKQIQVEEPELFNLGHTCASAGAEVDRERLAWSAYSAGKESYTPYDGCGDNLVPDVMGAPSERPEFNNIPVPYLRRDGEIVTFMSWKKDDDGVWHKTDRASLDINILMGGKARKLADVVNTMQGRADRLQNCREISQYNQAKSKWLAAKNLVDQGSFDLVPVMRHWGGLLGSLRGSVSEMFQEVGKYIALAKEARGLYNKFTQALWDSDMDTLSVTREEDQHGRKFLMVRMADSLGGQQVEITCVPVNISWKELDQYVPVKR